jgi:hypothetical protein
MNYPNVCTAGFTPLKYGTVEYSEDNAIAKFGRDGIEAYQKYFVPLEWVISLGRGSAWGFCKAVLDRHTGMVLELHY